MMIQTSNQLPLIFKYFPDLKSNINWVSLGKTPAPVHRLENLGYPNLWIKRTDLISPVYGGNKISRLEFILGDVLKRGKKKVVTMGGIGSNHCLATAIFCKKLNISCRLSLYDQPVTRLVKENLLLFYQYQAKMKYSKTYLRFGFDHYLMQRIKHPDEYFIQGGGSSPLGVLGVINEVFELKKQIDKGLLPEPRYIFYPTASNGGMAGLSLGLQLAGMKTIVMGVRVGLDKYGPLEFNTLNTVKKTMETTYKFLQRNASNIPKVKIGAPQMIEGYFGKGYGHPTSVGQEALELFQSKENIKLESVYTAKACAALIDCIRANASSTYPILYWHTFNSVDMSTKAATVDYHELPPEFHNIFSQ